MRGILGAIALLVVLAVIGLSAKQQLQAARTVPSATAAAAASAGVAVDTAGSTPAQSLRQMQHSIEDSVSRDIQARPRSDEER